MASRMLYWFESCHYIGLFFYLTRLLYIVN